MKRCYICKEFKELSEFGIRRRNPDGHSEACKVCKALKQREYYRTEKGNAKYKAYERSERRKELRNTPEAKEKRLDYNRSEPRKNKRKEYQQRDYVKAKKRIRNRKWKKENRDKHNADWAEYHARKLMAMPEWLTEEEKQFMIGLYKHAKYIEKMFGIKCHVDHIIPLRGKTVCGLHVPWNLQILTAEENMKKGNRI